MIICQYCVYSFFHCLQVANKKTKTINVALMWPKESLACLETHITIVELIIVVILASQLSRPS